jgi:DNA modification methylase
VMKPYFERDGIVLFHGDCREILPGLGMVDAVVTDPPYEITATGGGIGRERKYLSDITGFTDCGFDESMLASFDNWLCFGTLRQVPKLISAAADRRWMLLTWNKPNPTPLCGGNYLPDTEYAIHAWRNKSLFGDCEDKKRFFIHPTEQGKCHPNEKPLPLMEKCVINASDIGQTILDPFAGSCTTGVAAWRLGRKAILCELSEAYCEIGANRLNREMDQGRLFKPQEITHVQPSLLE